MGTKIQCTHAAWPSKTVVTGCGSRRLSSLGSCLNDKSLLDEE